MTKSRGIMPPHQRRRWTELELALLRRNYSDSRTEDLAVVLGRKVDNVYAKAIKLGLRKSEAYLASPAACRLRRGDEVGKAHRFQKGQVPANKGIKRPPGWSPGNMAKTQFKKGNMPHTWVPVGTYRINGDGAVEIKLAETPGPYFLRWKPVHRHVWELANGPIPPRHMVAFKPGRRTTDPALITLDALDLITYAENMRRNTLHTIYPPELVRATQLRAALTRSINRKAKEAEEA